VVDRLGRRILVGLVASATIAAGAWLAPQARHGTIGVALIVTGVVLLLGHVFLDLRRK
jgi:hypothetical protein